MSRARLPLPVPVSCPFLIKMSPLLPIVGGREGWFVKPKQSPKQHLKPQEGIAHTHASHLGWVGNGLKQADLAGAVLRTFLIPWPNLRVYWILSVHPTYTTGTTRKWSCWELGTCLLMQKNTTQSSGQNVCDVWIGGGALSPLLFHKLEKERNKPAHLNSHQTESAFHICIAALGIVSVPAMLPWNRAGHRCSHIDATCYHCCRSRVKSWHLHVSPTPTTPSLWQFASPAPWPPLDTQV